MKILQRLRDAAQALKSWSLRGNAPQIEWVGGRPRVTAGERSQFDQNTIIQACLSSILDAFVSTALVSATVGEEGEDEYDYGTDFAVLMTRPNPGQKISGKRFLKAMCASYVLDGNAYCEVEVDFAGDAVALWYLPHWCIEPKEDKETGALSHYEVSYANGTTKSIDRNLIVHIADGIDAGNRLKGKSPLKCLLTQVLTDNEADAYSAEIISNPAIVGWAFLPKDDDPGKENAEYMEAKMNSKFGRGGRGGFFVPSVPGDIKVLGFSPEQLALDKLRRIPEERITAVMNVPAIIAGLGAGLDRSTFSNSEEARRYFARYRMLSLWEIFAEEFSVQLLPRTSPQPEHRAGFDLRRVQDLQEPIAQRWERLGKAFERGGIKRSEYRRGLNYTADPVRDDIYFHDLVAAAPAKAGAEMKAKLADRRARYEALGLAQDADA